MGRKQHYAGAWALDVYKRQLERSEEENHRLQQTSQGIRSVVSFYAVQNSSLREQLDAVEEELHRVRQQLAAHDEWHHDDGPLQDEFCELEPSESGVHRVPTAPLAEREMASVDPAIEEMSDEELERFDDLTLIRGVDDLTEQVLNALGVYAYRQIVLLDADGWDRLATFVPSLASSVERVRWRHDAETLCHRCGAAQDDADRQLG